MSAPKFYICEHCGNIVGKIHDAGVPLMCCGQKMKELVPGTVEASTEKHIPVAAVEGNLVKVTVGAVEPTAGGQRKALTAGSAPVVTFALTGDDKPVAVYAYCNLHGLWMAEI